MHRPTPTHRAATRSALVAALVLALAACAPAARPDPTTAPTAPTAPSSPAPDEPTPTTRPDGFDPVVEEDPADQQPQQALLTLAHYDHTCSPDPCATVLTVDAPGGQWTVSDATGDSDEGRADGLAVLEAAILIRDRFADLTVDSGSQQCPPPPATEERTISLLLLFEADADATAVVEPVTQSLGTTTCAHDWPEDLVAEIHGRLAGAGVELPAALD